MVRQTQIGKISFCMLFCLMAPLGGQSAGLRGQLWSGLTLGSDPATGYRSHSELLGYIPTFSVRRSLGGELFIDGEWAYKGWLSTEVPAGDDFLRDGKQHRLWVRLAGEKFDLRVGLQRIAFGPGFILRPLSWFDTLDPRDPTGQTDGVEAVRVRVYPTPWLTLWGWVTRQGKWIPGSLGRKKDSPGGRAEILMPFMDLGLTYHYNRSDGLMVFGQPPAVTGGPEHRLALDLRADGVVGLWVEAIHSWIPEPVTIYSDQLKRGVINYQIKNDLIMVGLDYTFAVGQGLYVLVEHFALNRVTDIEAIRLSQESYYTALLASLPLGMFDRIIVIAQYDWQLDMAFKFLQWQRTYDIISLNLLVFANPERKDFDLPPASLPVTLAGFGTGMQFMIIYHH